MQNIGFAFSLIPLAKKMEKNKEEAARFLTRHAYSGDREQLSERWRTGDRLMANRRSEATLRLRTSQKKLPTSMEIVFFS